MFRLDFVWFSFSIPLRSWYVSPGATEFYSGFCPGIRLIFSYMFLITYRILIVEFLGCSLVAVQVFRNSSIFLESARKTIHWDCWPAAASVVLRPSGGLSSILLFGHSIISRL